MCSQSEYRAEAGGVKGTRGAEHTARSVSGATDSPYVLAPADRFSLNSKANAIITTNAIAAGTIQTDLQS